MKRKDDIQVLLGAVCLTTILQGKEETAKGVVVTTTLMIGAITLAVILLFLFLRARLRK